MEELLNIPEAGAARDPLDGRDHLFRDLVAAGAVSPVTEEEWNKGYNAYEEAGVAPEIRDQGGRLTCVAETCARYGRVLRKITVGDEAVLAASSLYPFIRLPNGGAYLRDGAKETVAGRLVPKTVLADEDASGNPIGETVAADPSRITPAVAELAKRLDVFENYRMLEGGTDDINLFAAAIRTGKGAILGFTGTNPGWSCPACRAPLAGESKWGHGVYGSAFGKTDVDAPGLPAGSKAVFTPNSWGGRYTFTTGRWKGYQAIPAAYFEAGEQTAVGFVKGIHVFPSWTIVPKDIVPPTQWIADFLKQHDNKLAQQNPGDGSFAIIAGGKFRTITEARAGLGALTCLIRGIDKTRTVAIDKETWNKLPATPL